MPSAYRARRRKITGRLITRIVLILDDIETCSRLDSCAAAFIPACSKNPAAVSAGPWQIEISALTALQQHADAAT